MRFNWLLSGAVGLLSLLCWMTPADAARLQSLSFTARHNRLTLTADSAVQPSAQLISDPIRVVIDLPGATIGRPALEQNVGGGIRAIRVGQFDPQTARVVVEMNPGYTIDPERIVFRSSNGTDWSIQLPDPQIIDRQVARARRTRAHSFNVQFPSIAEVPAPAPTRPSPTPNPAPAERPSTPLNRRWVVVVDPGHGGPDPGALGARGLRETDLNLDVSRRITALLQQQGVETILTRNEERDLDLDPRVQIAERANADLFVSIHINSLSLDRPDVNGTESYYYSSSGQQLARVLQNSMARVPQVQDRGVHQANFYVIKYTSMPAVLLELGFITGSSDSALLSNANFRGQMASAITNGILQYIQQHQ